MLRTNVFVIRTEQHLWTCVAVPRLIHPYAFFSMDASPSRCSGHITSTGCWQPAHAHMSPQLSSLVRASALRTFSFIDINIKEIRERKTRRNNCKWIKNKTCKSTKRRCGFRTELIKSPANSLYGYYTTMIIVVVIVFLYCCVQVWVDAACTAQAGLPRCGTCEGRREKGRDGREKKKGSQ